MIISLLLTAVMLASIAAGLALRRRAPAIAFGIISLSLAGLYFTWAPSQLTALAHVLGVGRGTDLVLYLWVSVTFLALAGLVLELRRLQRQLTLLAREFALDSARRQAGGRGAAEPAGPDTTAAVPAPPTAGTAGTVGTTPTTPTAPTKLTAPATSTSAARTIPERTR